MLDVNFEIQRISRLYSQQNATLADIYDLEMRPTPELTTRQRTRLARSFGLVGLEEDVAIECEDFIIRATKISTLNKQKFIRRSVSNELLQRVCTDLVQAIQHMITLDCQNDLARSNVTQNIATITQLLLVPPLFHSQFGHSTADQDMEASIRVVPGIGPIINVVNNDTLRKELTFTSLQDLKDRHIGPFEYNVFTSHKEIGITFGMSSSLNIFAKLYHNTVSVSETLRIQGGHPIYCDLIFLNEHLFLLELKNLDLTEFFDPKSVVHQKVLKQVLKYAIQRGIANEGHPQEAYVLTPNVLIKLVISAETSPTKKLFRMKAFTVQYHTAKFMESDEFSLFGAWLSLLNQNDLPHKLEIKIEPAKFKAFLAPT